MIQTIQTKHIIHSTLACLYLCQLLSPQPVASFYLGWRPGGWSLWPVGLDKPRNPENGVLVTPLCPLCSVSV